MLEQLTMVGKKFAREFIDSKQDIFVMVTDVDGEEVTVTAKFSPPVKKVNITREGVWNMFTQRLAEKP